MWRKERKKKKRGKKKKEKREKKGGEKKIYYVRQEKKKGKKQQKPDEPIGLFTKRKIRFFFFSSFLSDRDPAKRFFLPLVSQKFFFFFPPPPRVPWIGIESSMRVLYACIAFFIRERVKKFHCPFWQFFFFLFSSSVQSVFLIFLRLWIIVNNSQPQWFLLPFNREWLILSLFNFSSWKKGKSSETLRSLRSFNLWMIFQLSLSWSGSSSSKDPIDPTKKMTLEENFYRRFLYTTISRYY